MSIAIQTEGPRTARAASSTTMAGSAMTSEVNHEATRVEPALVVAGDEAGDDAQHQRRHDGEQGGQDADARRREQAREDVASGAVAAEQVLGARRGEDQLERRGVRVVRRDAAAR